MCDTLGFSAGNKRVFGKNSDRSPNEPQLLEYIPAAHRAESSLKATYITIPQVPQTHGILISRPSWMWGAEMGVNDCNVAIGNEALFTLGLYGDDALTGMDLVRLALERSSTAEEALDTITELLEQYGQGGNCGYDHHFEYDNAFFIMDEKNIYVLETCGKKWVYKEIESGSISNCISIRSDGDVYSGSRHNFAIHADPFMTLGSGALTRRHITASGVKKASSVQDVMKILRSHLREFGNPFNASALTSPCMHYGGLVGDHTTASLIVEFSPEKTVIWATGCSTPCVSLYKPWLWGNDPVCPVFYENDAASKKYWYGMETFRRSLIGKKLPVDYYVHMDGIQQSWLKKAEAITNRSEFSEFSRSCLREEEKFREYWLGYAFKSEPTTNPFFIKRWQKKNAILEKERIDSLFS